MPIAAIELGRVDLILPLKQIAFALGRLIQPAASALPDEARSAPVESQSVHV